ncbi:hypothetical protein JP74_14065 [Devosia sp. 17-2-E-8]|nr:hypothetical protein JP74_14065 [Devosia sp. 17-2-E-8]
MSDAWIGEYRNDLLVARRITPKRMIELLRTLEDVDNRYIEEARQLTNANVDYLSEVDLVRLVRSDITPDYATALAARNYEIIRRMSNLIPEILEHCSNKSDFSLRFAIQRIWDTCLEFHVVATLPRVDKVKNDLIATLSKADAQLSTLRRALEELSLILSGDFTDAVRSVAEVEFGHDVAQSPNLRTLDYDFLVEQVSILQALIEIKLVDLRSDRPRERLIANQAKTDIAECVYDLTRCCGGPPLVTTPGSGFSYLCGLLLEIATGQRDQSMAGVVNRFSRSQGRREQDAYDQEELENEAAFESGDNFHFIRRQVEALELKAKLQRETSQAAGLSDMGRVVCLTNAIAIQRRIDELLRRNGPFIVWASQMPATGEDDWAKFSEWQEKIREGNLALGRARRMKDQST